jgi:LacI family transcriptional regulator
MGPQTIGAIAMTRRKAARREGRRPHVALIIETSLGSGRDILRGVARYVREHEPWALYHEPHGLEASVPQWLRRWNGDGIIARIQTRRIAQQLAASGIPVVDVLGVVPELAFPLVSVDNVAIARMAAEHLLERGFRRFGFFGIEGENWSEQRYAGFCAAVAPVQAQVPICRLPRDAKGRRSWERAEDDIARWIAALPKPAGVLICSDQRGSQFLEACRRAGVSVPNEIAVVSVDNDEPLCEVCLPPLSSVEPGHLNVGYQAAALLDSMLRGGSASRKPLHVQPLETVTRQSSDTLAVADSRVGMALRLIRENAPSGMRIDDIAREVGLSRSVLQRRFRATLHCSIHQEILNVRIRHARELLATTEISLAAVAEQAGFKHQEYLGAVFRARVGKTPAQVREDAR